CAHLIGRCAQLIGEHVMSINLNDVHSMSSADLDAYMALLREAKKEVKRQESLRVGNLLRESVETVLAEQEITIGTGKTPWAGYKISGVTEIDGKEFTVSLTVTDRAHTQALKDAIKAGADA